MAGSHITSLALALTLLAAPFTAFAQVPKSTMGTWTVNLAKSKYNPGPPPTSTVSVWEPQLGGAAKNTIDLVDAAGKTSRMELITTFDGRESNYKGAAEPTTRAYTRIDDLTYLYVERVNGTVTTTNKITIAPNGKTRVQETKGTGPDGRAINNRVTWDRQ